MIKKMNVCISCNTLLVHQVTKLRTKSWELIELGTLTNGLTIVTSRLFLAISNFIYQKERSIIDCFLSSTLDRKKNLEQANLRASSPGLSGGGATKEGLLAG